MRQLTLIIGLILGSLCTSAQAPDFAWAKQAQDKNFNSHERGNGIAHDSQGNSYVTGNFNGNSSFGSTTLTSSGRNDIFVAKYDTAGNVLWAKKAGGTDSDSAFSIAIDGSGNSYIAGAFEGSATFGSITLTSSGSADVFVTKYDASGNVLWAKKAGGANTDEARCIAVDSNGNSYLTGYFQGSAVFGSTTLTSSGSRDVFLAKYDAAGNVLWAKKAGGFNKEVAYSIAVDGSGNSYVTGYFTGSITFGSTTLTSSGSQDIFVAKYDAFGNVQWAKKAGGASTDEARSIAVDGSGNSYITGYFQGNPTFGSTTFPVINGTQDVFVAKYDSLGNVLWVKAGGGLHPDYGFSIAVDGSGNSYVTGRFAGHAFFGGAQIVGNAKGYSSSLSGSYDVFVVKYDAAGNVLWAKDAGGISDADGGYGIAVDGNGNSYITGYFQESADFGYGPNYYITLHNFSTESTDVFVAKYDAAGNLLWAEMPGGTNYDEARSIAVDGSGNSYVTGYFEGNATFGNTMLTSNGSIKVFLAKYDAAGNVIWAKKTGGTNADVANSITVDGSGNSYITGYFYGSITVGSTTLTSSGNSDIFLAKYDAAGNALWAKKAGSSLWDEAAGIAVDGSGNSYITGSFQGSATFGSITLNSSGNNDVFLAKYDAAGNLLWAKKAGGSLWYGAASIAVDGSGNSYITGSFYGSATFGSTTLTHNGGNDVFVAKYDATGNVLWAKKAGGSYNDRGNSIAVDGNGNCYITGAFQDTAVFGSTTLINPSEETDDIFLAKYDSAGNVLWAKSAGGNYSDDIARSIAIDGNGNSYIIGYFEYNLTFGSTTLINPSGSYGEIYIYDIFVAKYDAAGNALWAKRAGGPFSDNGNGIAVDGSGNSYITGAFQGSGTFGNTTFFTVGTGVFVAKIAVPGPNDVAVSAITSANSGCSLTNQETITITVHNWGTAAQSNIPVSYKINNGTPVTEVFAGPLAPNTSVNYSFITKANLSTLGTYNIEAKTTLSGDGLTTNDIFTKAITNYAVPPAPTVSTGSATTTCTGGTVVLAASSPVWGVTYQWFNNGTAITGATSAIYTANAAGNYTAIALGAGGCSSSASVATAITMTPPPPNINVTGSLVICSGDSVALTAASTVSGTTFTWFKNGNVIAGATTATYMANTTGSYTVTATANSCVSPASLASNVFMIPVPAKPTITQAGFILTSSSTSGNQWYKDNVAIAGATAQSYTTTSNGSYKVIVTDNGCPSEPSNEVVISTTGLSADRNSLNMAVYPNPSNGLFNITLPEGSDYKLTVTDLTGKVIRQLTTKDKNTHLNISSAAKGVYLLKIIGEGKTAMRKLVVE